MYGIPWEIEMDFDKMCNYLGWQLVVTSTLLMMPVENIRDYLNFPAISLSCLKKLFLFLSS